MPKTTELIKGCQKGNRKSQYELYQQFSSGMMAVAMRYSKSTLEAEDILQEGFIKVFENIKKFRGDSSIGYWIKRIIINTALNHQRSKLYLYPMVDVEEIREGVDSLSVDNLAVEDLMELVQNLPTGCQVIFNLYAIEGYQHKEIAKMLDISIGTSKSQYARARKILIEQIEKQSKWGNERFQ
ncbi:RNA polymerase sigma factor [Marivirga arenosa]|uniref:Sigma-70 family RNA polymerase sigma factor n=1 Tax=Marivirga arenosa TaxID=3059076 RepID=A0AA49JDU3_9BACT|nr:MULTISPECIES: sigma-70 family RNA polymerase sigma factor [unclassified Marivirga]WKK82180.2 sigma-70 family RNA polymerase sigma factor [Marivirga sp. BKB1-2]WKK87113.2 sigma-70 family RNA polymerase sigma factor [Marivirga sp. ABR2-2]